MRLSQLVSLINRTRPVSVLPPVWKVFFSIAPIPPAAGMGVSSATFELKAYGAYVPRDEPVQRSPIIPGYHKLLAQTTNATLDGGIQEMISIIDEWAEANGVQENDLVFLQGSQGRTTV